MALTTRCPQCGTSFKVVPDQLRVRNGLVRCGACATVFDGRACLLPATGVPAADVPKPAAVTPQIPPAPAEPPASAVPQAIAAPVLAPSPDAPAPSVGEAPPAQRASAEPRAVAPWDDLPAAPDAPESAAHRAAAPAPAAPAVPPAVLRGREDIRRRIEPDAVLAQEGDDDEDENEDLDRYDEASRPDPVPPWQAPAGPRDEPLVAVRDSARRDAPRSPRPAEPVFVVPESPRPGQPGHGEGAGGYRHHDDRDDDGPRDHDDGGAEPILGDLRTRYSSATDVGRAPPEFLDQDRQERRGLLRRLWGYACLAGLLALGLQLLYVYRIDLANSVPVLRPALEAACQPLGCKVGYARRLERIAISSSSLQPPAGAAAIDDGRTRLVLNLVLRNRYDKPQHWPALVLDLTDLSDTVVVRRVLMPENYLTPEQLRGPFEPAGELKISVPIEVTGVQVNGYQLDKFFP